MNESNSIKTIDKTILCEQTFGIENYFYQEINQGKSYSNKLNKYITAFDCMTKFWLF